MAVDVAVALAVAVVVVAGVGIGVGVWMVVVGCGFVGLRLSEAEPLAVAADKVGGAKHHLWLSHTH